MKPFCGRFKHRFSRINFCVTVCTAGTSRIFESCASSWSEAQSLVRIATTTPHSHMVAVSQEAAIVHT